MKKVLLLSLGLMIGLAGYAQIPVKKGDAAKQSVLTSIKDRNEQEVPMNFAPSTPALPKVSQSRSSRDFEEFTTMTTKYDLQSNSTVANRIAVWPDGTAAVTATWGLNSSTSWDDRGTGYNYYDGSSFGDEPTARLEPVRSGWPSIAPCGDGEILASHNGTGVTLYKRAVKGEGEWEVLYDLNNGMTWPRIATSGENGQYVHLIVAEQKTDSTTVNRIYYLRSTDGGATWSEPAFPPQIDLSPAGYNFNIGADDYVFATNGDDVALLCSGMTYDVFYIISHDNGETWEKQVVAEHPYQHFNWYEVLENNAPTSETDSIWWADNSASIAIGPDGTVHVAFGLCRWVPAPASGVGYYSYWPYTDAIIYWNSNYVNEQGGNQILPFGQFSEDANHPEWLLNGPDGKSSMMNDTRLEAMCNADPNQNLHMFGWPDETGDGVVDYTELWDNNWGSYRTLGISTQPSIAIDENGRIGIVYNVLSETRNNGSFYYRSAYMTYRDEFGEWMDDCENLCSDFGHTVDEAYNTVACANGYDGTIWVAYQADEGQGLFLDSDQTAVSDNIIYAVKVATRLNTTDNPMTEVTTNVYPNPTTANEGININSSMNVEAVISIHNIAGQLVKTTNRSLSVGINNVAVNDLETGVYFCTISANGYDKTVKIVVR